MTRDEARALWAESGLTYADLNFFRLQHLIDFINDDMTESDLMVPANGKRGTYRVNSRIRAGIQHDGWWVYLRCRSHYFRSREAVSFESNGFIGFAGWSDDTNVEPILTGFAAWVAWMLTVCRP